LRYSSYRRPETGEVSALETDVVRFVAVVGLTLMVVFALVHALPYRGDAEGEQAEAAPAERPAPSEDLILIPRDELERAVETATAHEREALELSSRLADEQARAAEAANRARREKSRATVLTQEVDRAMRQARSLGRRLASTEEELRDARQEIAVLETLAQPEPVPEPEAPVLEAEPEAIADTEPPPAASPEPAGNDAFVLRFRDDAVYLDLLERERVRSYVHVPGLRLTYEISRDRRGRLDFALIYDAVSERMYRIPDAMVPGVLLESTRNFDRRLAGRGDLEYLVVLSDRIRGQVDRLESAGRAGTWDILSDETVVAAASAGW
jgi:hypothetical protein